MNNNNNNKKNLTYRAYELVSVCLLQSNPIIQSKITPSGGEFKNLLYLLETYKNIYIYHMK